MSSKQNPFEEMFKLWQEHTNKMLSDPENLKKMTEEFTRFQMEFLKKCRSNQDDGADKGSSSSFNDIHSNIYDTVITLTNRINNLESRITELEREAKKRSRK